MFKERDDGEDVPIGPASGGELAEYLQRVPQLTETLQVLEPVGLVGVYGLAVRGSHSSLKLHHVTIHRPIALHEHQNAVWDAFSQIDFVKDIPLSQPDVVGQHTAEDAVELAPVVKDG